MLTVARREWEGGTAQHLTSLGHTLSISLWKCSLIEQGDTSCNVRKFTIQSYHTVSNLHDYLHSTASGPAYPFSIILPLRCIPGAPVVSQVQILSSQLEPRTSLKCLCHVSLPLSIFYNWPRESGKICAAAPGGHT
ncbi:hypothetical protein CY34DRAFT_480869 [Suillus luteus UH-Slu-Lm8-n1]|uniref:Uncharacterized protein n=1 Tax=Suillus luteus UH-Slu-Lm8-n1 TaxID=930992 RepID=A0A0D0A6Z5_9AGAM|nr:hypothetical protein CY34DRAFT_480869 [Suillus luteus UH-Slu-Lm8-n1]